MKRAIIDSQTSEDHNSTDEYGKRCYTKIEELKYWMILDIVPGGLQNKDAGRDQTPILHLACIIGSIETGEEIARKSTFIKPVSFLRQSITSSALALQSSILTNKANMEHQNDLKEQTDVETSQHAILAVPILAIEESGLALKYTEASELLDLVKQFSTFQEALQDIVNFVESKMTENNEETLPLLITDSHTSIRNVFHREIMHRCANGQLSNTLAKYPLWFRYLDIGTIAFRATRSPSNHEVPHDVEGAASLMNIKLEKDIKTEYSRADLVYKIFQACLQKKISLSSPHMIDDKYTPKVLSSDHYISSDCVIEIRQVPWTATPIILANFFAGLNICPGGVAILLSEGRRSNTAYILFTDAIMARLALARHQHQLPSSVLMNKFELGQNSKTKCNEAIDELMHAQVQRITTLQVFPGSSKDFLVCSKCDKKEVIDFLNQLTNGDQVVVRIRGLPYSTTKDRVVTFFKEVNAILLNQSDKSIFLVTYPDKRPTGDAFVLFNDEHMANKALTRHKNYVGERYVELFKASPSEMIQVCNNVSNSHSLSGKSANYTLNQLQIPASNPIHQMNQLKTNLLMQPGLDTKLFPSILQTPNAPSLFHGQLGIADVNLNHNFYISPNFPASTMSPVFPTTIGKCVTEDLTDPTDPNCPFARPLPQSGTSAMMQISNLPFDTSRHLVRLYLGPANFAKIYRMKRTEQDLTTGSKWLLSLENSTEAVKLIKDLLEKTFPNNTLVTPIFGLFGVAFDGQLYPINLTEFQMEIPSNRIALICGGTSVSLPQDNQFDLMHSPFFLNNSQFVKIPQQNDGSKNMLDMSFYDQQAYLNKSMSVGNINECSLYISGLPNNVTHAELINIFKDISSLFVNQPKFVHVQSQNDLCLYCAIFSSPLEVQLCLSLNGNPQTILRNGQYIAVLTPCYVPQQSNLAIQLTPGHNSQATLPFDQLTMISNFSSLPTVQKKAPSTILPSL